MKKYFFFVISFFIFISATLFSQTELQNTFFDSLQRQIDISLYAAIEIFTIDATVQELKKEDTDNDGFLFYTDTAFISGETLSVYDIINVNTRKSVRVILSSGTTYLKTTKLKIYNRIVYDQKVKDQFVNDLNKVIYDIGIR